MRKPNERERIDRAQELVNKIGKVNINIKDDTLEAVKKCIKIMGIEKDTSFQLIDYNNVPSYEKMP